MNFTEYSLLEKGISYVEVVAIAGGGGEETNPGVYVWLDEILLTQAYEIHFQNDKLVSKKIIEKRGYSTR